MNTNDKNDVRQFEALILSEKYYNEDSAWGCFMFSTKDDVYCPNTQKDGTKICCLVGKMQHLQVGATYNVKATYQVHKLYGGQYNPVSVYAVAPKDRNTQLLFLESLIAPKIAENLLNAYPNIVNDVIDGNISEIDYSTVKGVGKATWKKIKNKITDNYLVSDIIVMLIPLGVTYTMIKKLLENEPNPVLLKQNLENNPYILTKIKGFGFKKVDGLSLKLKPELRTSIERLAAFIVFYLKELGENEGHTYVTIDNLQEAVSKNVPECTPYFNELIENNIFLYKEKNKIGLKSYYETEMSIFEEIKSRFKEECKQLFTDEQIENAIKSAETEQGFEYTDEQREVIKTSLKRNVSIISGIAGSGKSSIMRAIIKAYSQNNYVLLASALSAMAAQRISEASSYEAMTIHRTLGAQGFDIFKYNKNNKLIAQAVFIDEGSMVSAILFRKWLDAVGNDTRIIISGDHKQLPPIGYGNIFSDLIERLGQDSKSVLTKPMRQAQMSGILSDANMIRENRNPIKAPASKLVTGQLQDMHYMFRNDRQSLFNIAVKTYLLTASKDGTDNVVIVVPRKQNCLNSTERLNAYIQDKLFDEDVPSISNSLITFRLGARVMQTVNDYERNIFNGEIGYITEIGKKIFDRNPEEYCLVTFKNVANSSKNKIVTYRKKDLAALDLAYAITTHKIQGGGIDTVIGIIDNTHYQLLDNCMLYTMLTRAKKRCLLLAEPNAFLKCIRTSHNKRNTWIRNLKK